MATDLRRPKTVLDPLSFERFYRLHLGEIYRYVLRDVGNRADAEEVTQTAFLDAYRALRRGHEPKQPRAWMYGIARNAARRRFRTQSRRPHEVELAPELSDRLTDEEESHELEAVRAAIVGLRPSHREVVFLREVEGLSYAEIARRMKLTHSAVETLLFRARRSLRELLEAEGLGPSVRTRAKRLRGLLVFPAFLGRLGSRTQQLLAPELAGKAAGALTAVTLSAGLAIGTQVLSGQAATGRDEVRRAVAPPSNAALAVLGGRLEPNDGDAKATKRKRDAKERPARGDGRPQTDGGPRGNSGPDSGGSAGSAGSGSGGVAVSTPSVNIPSTQLPSVAVPAAPVQVPSIATPEIATPEVEVPSVTVELPEETGGILGG